MSTTASWNRLKEIHEAAEDVIDALADSELVPKKSAGQKQEQATRDESNGKQPSFCEPVDANSLAPAWRHKSAILCIVGELSAAAIEAGLLRKLTMLASSLRVGACYVTNENELRKIVQFEGGLVCYVVRGKMTYPSWDKERWHSITSQAFATEVLREISCDSHPL